MIEGTIIEFEAVEKRFGSTTALDGLSFRVPAGSITGLLGPNGSGKTTCLRLILNLFRPDAGEISVLGEPPNEAVSDAIGYLPEERGLYRRMKVHDILAYYARLKGHTATKNEIREWLGRLGMAEYARHQVGELSKGMAQKIQFVATVLHGPRLVILDEPFSGLDPVSAQALQSAIRFLMKRGATVLLSTHDMNLAESFCDRFLMVHCGKKVLDIDRAELDTRYGEKTLKVTTNEALPDLQGVQRVLERGNYYELLPEAGVDPRALLRDVCSRITVERCEVSRPSLRDLFLRLAGPEA